MKRSTVFALVASLVLVLCRSALAQNPPPFFGGGTAYDPEVGIVESGALLDAQVTVSADRKYVTITTGATNTRLLGLTLFPVVNVGFVGGATPGGGDGAAGAGAAGGTAGATGRGAARGGNSPASGNGINTSPAAIANQNSILNREGMFLLAPLR